MQRNCGVLAYDKLVGELNGRSNVISMDTLAKLATDNGFLLYPTKVPLERMTDIPLPCVVYTSHHFVFIEDLAHLDPVCMSRESVYLLTHELVNPDWVMTEREAKGIRGADIGQMFTPPKSKSPWEAMTSGSTGGWAGFAGPTNPRNAGDAKGWGWVGPAITAAAGAIPIAGPFISAGMGAAGSMNNGTGFQGTDKGWGNVGSTLLGAAGGYGLGSLGAGASSAIQGGMNGLIPVAGGGYTATGTPSLSGALTGFGQGVSNYFAPVTNAVSGAYNNVAGAMKGLLGGGASGGFEAGAAGEAGGAGAGGFNFTDLLDLGGGLMSMFGTKQGTQETASLFDQGFMQLPEVQAFAAQIGQAKTALGQMSQDELAKIIQAPVGSIIPDDNAYYTAATRRVQEAGELKKQQTTEAYNSIGRVNSSEHMAELAKIDKDTANSMQDVAAVLANQKLTLEIQYKTAAIAQALGVDQNTAAEILGLTGLSVAEAAMKYRITEEEAAQLRATARLENNVSPAVGNILGNVGKIANLIGGF